MVLGILKESGPERRVALLPEAVSALVKLKVKVLIEKDAGAKAFAADKEFETAGASALGKEEVIRQSDVILKINPPTPDEIPLLTPGKVFIAVFNPLMNKDMVKKFLDGQLTTFSMDMVPRTTRAQSMDILSSMATVNGYKAVLTAASLLPKFFPMFMTAAGTITPSKVLILGAGVAGLQAIATSRRLGAVVEVFDVRAAVKEEVTGIGGKFIEVEGAMDDKAAGGYAVEQSEEFKKRQAAVIHEHAVKSDVVICTAQIPGKKAPVLLKKETVESMKPGSVIIDLASSTGGNCELTADNSTIDHRGVTILGNSSFAVDMPSDASKLYGKNMINFLKLMIGPEGDLLLNFDDDIVRNTCITHQGNVLNEKVKAVITS
jgi:H+-translocating NAD(P) transhydrogenase subunit alpha